MKIIGREKEQELLGRCLESKRPELLVVYGRMRVGKTYLIREYFKNRFAFYTSGIPRRNTTEELRVFHVSLSEYGDDMNKQPVDWIEAFSRLKRILMSEHVRRDPISGKRVVFLDEVPWMDTESSDFKAGLDFFWNTWGSAQEDLLLIVCGSVTSWVITHLLNDEGGFYQRVTHRMHVLPFTLKECELLLSENSVPINHRQIMSYYLVFGGIPFYLCLIDSRLSIDQNINELFFKEHGELRYEYDHLFRSLFQKPEKHVTIVNTLCFRHNGMTRTELVKKSRVDDDESLTRVLNELMECGFIRKYQNYEKEESGNFYQVIDPFILFCNRFMPSQSSLNWLSYIHTPEYYAWRGLAFEILCLNHIDQIKDRLGISGIESNVYSWRSMNSQPAVQIDLLIDRRDDVINLCEMKFTNDPFTLSSEEERKLLTRMSTFQNETGTRKAIHLTLVSAEGITGNIGSLTRVITGEDLFKV